MDGTKIDVEKWNRYSCAEMEQRFMWANGPELLRCGEMEQRYMWGNGKEIL
jgi:hypothetical protein